MSAFTFFSNDRAQREMAEKYGFSSLPIPAHLTKISDETEHLLAELPENSVTEHTTVRIQQAVSEADLEALWAAIEAEPGIRMTVDLVERTAEVGDLRVSFDIDDYTRWRLLEGLDDIGITLTHGDDITAFEGHRPAWMPATA